MGTPVYDKNNMKNYFMSLYSKESVSDNKLQYISSLDDIEMWRDIRNDSYRMSCVRGEGKKCLTGINNDINTSMVSSFSIISRQQYKHIDKVKCQCCKKYFQNRCQLDNHLQTKKNMIFYIKYLKKKKKSRNQFTYSIILSEIIVNNVEVNIEYINNE